MSHDTSRTACKLSVLSGRLSLSRKARLARLAAGRRSSQASVPPATVGVRNLSVPQACTVSALLLFSVVALSPSFTRSSVASVHSHSHAGHHPGHSSAGAVDDTVHGDAMHMMMQMYFQAGTHVTLWLRSWHTSTLAQYIISFIGLLLLAVAAEGLAALRARLARSASATGGAGSGNAVWADDAAGGGSGSAEPLLGFLTARASTPARLRAVLALLYASNIAVAYLLMLAVMTYNVGYFAAIVAGLGLGHFAFADIKAGAGGGGDACCPQP